MEALPSINILHPRLNSLNHITQSIRENNNIVFLTSLEYLHHKQMLSA